jgi:hypothetical protein
MTRGCCLPAAPGVGEREHLGGVTVRFGGKIN